MWNITSALPAICASPGTSRLPSPFLAKSSINIRRMNPPGVRCSLPAQYQPGIDRAELFRRHSEWASRFPVPAKPPKSKRSKGALRIGFLSPDLGNHPVGIFLAPLLERLRGRKI